MSNVLEKESIVFKAIIQENNIEENIESKTELQYVKIARKLYSQYEEDSQNYADQIYNIIKTLPVNHNVVYTVILLHASIHKGCNLANYRDKFSSNILYSVDLTDKIISFCYKIPSCSVHDFSKLIPTNKELAEISIFSSLVLHLYKVSILNGVDALSHEMNISKIISSYYIPYLISHIEYSELTDILQDLCFKIQSPSVRNNIIQKIYQLYPNIVDITDNIKTELQYTFKQSNIEANINYRIKSPQSIYTKTFVKNVGVETLHDIIGFRVIVQNVEDCYVVAKLIDTHKVFNTIDSLGVDYITSPKSNGYQSIHKVVSWNNNRIELQIRSTNMHRQTRFESAHSQYKITKYFSYNVMTIMMPGQSVVIDTPVLNMQNNATAINKTTLNLYALFAILPLKNASTLNLDVNIHDHIDLKLYSYPIISPKNQYIPDNQHLIITLLQLAQVIKPHNMHYNAASLHNTATRIGNTVFVNNIVKYNFSVDDKNSADISLHNAAISGNLELIKHLVKNGSSIDAKNRAGETPLYHAVIGGHIDSVKYLVECKADINARTTYTGMTPLLYAAFYKDIKLVKDLIKLDADININNTYGSSVLWSIVRKGDIELTKELVKLGANVNVISKDGETLLHAAAFSGNLELVRYVIEELGVNDVHAKGTNDKTPLHYAARSDNIHIIQYLLEHCRADINARNDFNETPLLYAAKHGKLSAAQYLISLGADININNTCGDSVLWHVVWHGDIELTKELVKLGANVNVKHNVCGTLLHAAAFSGNLELVRYVIEKLGVNDVHAKDMRGYIPIDWAKQKGNVNIEQFLIKQECSANIIQDMSSPSCSNILYDKIYLPPKQSKALNNVISTDNDLYEQNGVLAHLTLSGTHTEFDYY